MRMRIFCCLLLILSAAVHCFAQEYFPDIEKHETLICDFHTHTVFSDGLVWPTVRIDEAKREGIDVISISDHIEYLPHKNDIRANHNRSYEIAAEYAKNSDVLLIKGTEITRGTPPGHYNALFINDVDPLDVDGFLAAIEAANKQNAFLFWNHHAWKGDERGKWEDVQDTMFENKWLHGMEVANAGDYYPSAHKWCLEKGLTMLGNSDIHGPYIDYKYTAEKHRTLTLVFARDRSIEAVEEALRKGRTAVWLGNRLIGQQKYLWQLFARMVNIGQVVNKEGTNEVELTNDALIDLQLARTGDSGPEKITLPARSTITVQVPADAKELKYTVENMLIEPDKGLEVLLEVK